LLFADDSLLFRKANRHTALTLKAILDCFCSQSSHLINFHKSAIVFSNNAIQMQKQVVASIFQILQRHSLGKYFHYPLFQGRSRKGLFIELVDKAKKKVVPWKASLIQSNLEAYRHMLCNV